MREGVAPRPAPAGARSAALSVSAVRYSTTPTSLSHEGTWDDVKVTAPISVYSSAVAIYISFCVAPQLVYTLSLW